MPVGTLDPMFRANVVALTASNGAAALATLNASLRKWMLGDVTKWTGEPLDVFDLANAFLRTNVGLQYGTALASPLGSSGDAASAKVQSDSMAVMERSFRLRHATNVRCALHAASRRAGQSSPLGSPSRLGMYAQDLLVAGGAGFRPRR